MKTHLSFVLVVCLGIGLSAQTRYTLNSRHEFVISGTSNLHDWTMKSKSAEGEATIIIEKDKVKNINSLTVKLETESLKSGKKAMDNNAYKALHSKESPSIQF